VRQDGRTVGGEGWQGKVHNREEWKKLLRTARNCHILHMAMEGMNVKYNEKENWRILTNKQTYARVKKPTVIETVMLNRLGLFGHVQRMEENRIPKRVLCIIWEQQD
jgi:hypothetical protein